MSNLVTQNTKETKAVKVSRKTWESISHESIARYALMRDLVDIAWDRFMKIPEGRRERIVREAE